MFLSRCELTLERLTIDSIFRSLDFAFRAQETDFETSFCISGVSESFCDDLPDNLSYGHLLLNAGMAVLLLRCEYVYLIFVDGGSKPLKSNRPSLFNRWSKLSCAS